jgi:hypothetical protein
MSQATALGNNDVAFIAWSYDSPIADCLGFAVYRQSSSQPAPTPLPAWVGFEGDSNADWQPRTTEEWPVQKFSWRDLTASAGATYVYTIVPMVGEPGNLEPAADPSLKLTTNPITLTPERSDHVRAYFNRGILSTQHLVHELPQGPDGGPSSAILLDHIKTVGDSLRASLAGQSIEALSSLLVKAVHEGGRCQGAIYELNDPQLIALLDTPARVSLVLSNAGGGDNADGTNTDARARLHADGVDVHDRMLGSGHIGHDKFLVYIGPDGKPQTVLTGSTNWTYTGLCAQSNNAVQIDDEALATTYIDFWDSLKSESFPSPARATQSNTLRSRNDAPRQFTIDGAETTLWFSPNTHLHSKPDHDAPEPDDMKQVFELIAGAKHGILFLLFQPGSPSVLDEILKAQQANHDLVVRGAATDAKAIRNYETQTPAPRRSRGRGRGRRRCGRPVLLLAARAPQELARCARDHPRQDRRDRSVLARLRGDHGQPQPRLPRLVQQRREPVDREGPPQAGRGVRRPRDGRVRPLPLALAAPGARRQGLHRAQADPVVAGQVFRPAAGGGGVLDQCGGARAGYTGVRTTTGIARLVRVWYWS